MIRSPHRATTQWRIHSQGKAAFLNFMLTQLISAGQVVLLCNASEIYLFYCGQVYSRLTVSSFYELPKRKGTRYCPIWTLIDADFKNEGPPLTHESNTWPIHAAPPNPIQWKAWQKQYQSALWGMPLWDMEELIEGYVPGLFPISAIDPGHVVR
jgi:hypothetical protein